MKNLRSYQNIFYFVGVITSISLQKQWNKIVVIPIQTINKNMIKHVEKINLSIVLKSITVIETIEAYLTKHNIDTYQLLHLSNQEI